MMMVAYKLLRKRKNGSLGSLFINKRKKLPIGCWLTAESHKTRGYALRPGWHALLKPQAPHLLSKDRIWAKVKIKDYQFIERPAAQGGVWVIAQKMKILKLLKKETTG